MKRKNSARDNLNLFFSAFLILAYIVCGYFFIKYANTLQETMQATVIAIVFVVFGLLLFYATRVGDGAPVKRFSLITLILVVLPSLYAILASVISVLPLHAILQESPMLTYMAGVALGYGIPYTFVSGFEIVEKDAEEEVKEETEEITEETTEEAPQEETAEEAQEDEEVVEGIDSENYQDDEEVVEGVDPENSQEEVVVEGVDSENSQEEAPQEDLTEE